MPLYDFICLMKPQVPKREVVEILKRVAKRVYDLSGVVTDVKSYGTDVPLAYDIKKRDGRYRKAQMVQMTFMSTPDFPKELQSLRQDERLLRWLIVRNRGHQENATREPPARRENPRFARDEGF
eukprot:TRINITY_DN3661_c0_g1_i1.p1 TRINITY_DN3661_c0_g1~~TRINITY_DN3661_c0_g1_i1.p1  ORF type:complete len:124 (+),score=19.27 TRINITY_DN3661_c0_g1_i1:201-572(+)